LIGDLSLYGMQIIGHIISKKGGHKSNIKFLNIIEKKLKDKNNYIFNKDQIKEVIPHRDPFLLIDKIIDFIPRKKVIAEKKVTNKDYYLKGHFPNNPIMPGVLIIECMAQASCFLSLDLVENRHNKMMLLSNIKSSKFIDKVIPGDLVQIEVNLLKFKLNTALFQGTARVKNKQIAICKFMATVVEKI